MGKRSSEGDLKMMTFDNPQSRSTDISNISDTLRIAQGIDFVKTCETLNFEKHLDLKNI